MEPTDTATTMTPQPPSVADSRIPKTRACKRQRPLGDVTNLLPKTPTPRNPRRPLPLPSDTSASISVSTPTSASASATPISKPPSAAVDGRSNLVEPAISTVYARRKTRRRGSTGDEAAFAGTASCPPLGKAARTNERTSGSEALDSRPTSSSVPCHQAKRKKHAVVGDMSSGTPKLPEDFVKKLKSYFDEIDAFELVEEEASETDLE